MNVLTAAEMSAIESSCGIPGPRLMDRAADAAIKALGNFVPLADTRVFVMAGKGNNGGDGFTVAHKLHGLSGAVKVFTPAEVETLSNDAATNYEIAQKKGVAFIPESEVEKALGEADIVIDALLGTGLASAVREPYAHLIKLINAEKDRRRSLFVFSIDLPSGVSSDDGAVFGIAVRADATVTFGRPKRGHFLYPGAGCVGTLVADDIGIPAAAFDAIAGNAAQRDEMAALLPRREPTAHKGKSKLLIVGGCAGMTGAVLLAAGAALKCDAGYVFVTMPDSARDSGFPIEAVRRPAPSRPGSYFALGVDDQVMETADGMHAAVIGGGFGRHNDERALGARLVRLLPCPTVVDADILHVTATREYQYADGPRVLTPHPGEFSALFGGTIAENESDRISVTVKAAERCRQVVVHKGRPTIVAAPDGRYTINTTGNERLATCGSGDVLAGIIGAFLARGLSPYEAARVGAYLHGKTVEFWDYPVGLTAAEIIRLIPSAWKALIALN